MCICWFTCSTICGLAVWMAFLMYNVGVHTDLYGCDVMCGGATTVADVGERIPKELTALVPSTMRIKVAAPSEARVASEEHWALLLELHCTLRRFVNA